MSRRFSSLPGPATAAGITRSEGEQWGRDASPEYLRSAVEKGLRILQVDVIDLYQSHRPDRSVVCADAIGVFADLKAEGKIKAVGVSNASVEELEIAVEVVLAWELAKGDHVIPIPGASRPASIIDSAKAADLELTDDEFARLDFRPGW